MEDEKDQDVIDVQKMDLNEPKNQCNISIDQAASVLSSSEEMSNGNLSQSNVEDKDRSMNDHQKMDLDSIHQSNSYQATAVSPLSEKLCRGNLSYSNVKDKHDQDVNDDQKMDLIESKNKNKSNISVVQTATLSSSSEEMSNSKLSYTNVEVIKDQDVNNDQKMDFNESKNQRKTCNDQATALSSSSMGNLLCADVEDRKDQDIYGEKTMELDETKNQSNIFSDQETALSESEWEDEEPISRISNQQGKGQKNRRHKDRKRKKKLPRSKGQALNSVQILEHKNSNLLHNQSEIESEMQRSISNLEISNQIEQTHNIKTEVNKSELNNLCPLNSYSSPKEGNLNNTCNKSKIGFDKKINSEFSQNCENVNSKKYSKMEAEDKNSPASMIDKIRQTQYDLLRMEKSIQPSDVIMDVRKDIEKLSNGCIAIHME